MTSTSVVRPPRLSPGARVALVCPSGAVLERDDLTRASDLVRALGLAPVQMPNADRRFGYLAGTDDERLDDLQRAIGDESIAAIWAVRGGFGTTRILRRIDFSPLRSRPKVLLGFSDVTSVLLKAYADTGLVTFHGPVSRNGLTPFAREHLERLLFDPAPAGKLSQPKAPAGVLVPREPRVVPLVPGIAEGPLVGGNLTLIQCLVGTGALPSFDGAILFLEETSEDLYRVDRMLAHLRDAGLLTGLAGVAIGLFTDMRKGAEGGTRSFEEVLRDYLEPLGIPAARGFPIGHVDDQWTLPIGARARLDADAGTIALLEGGVA
jgi:muramoyltetrapeptide carboxypeptidase